MKQGSYNVSLLLERTKEDMASILAATCQCTAGYVIHIHHNTCLTFFNTCRKSASYTDISALLHALAAMTPVPFLVASSSVTDDEDADSIPCTSLPCQWKHHLEKEKRVIWKCQMLHLRNMSTRKVHEEIP